MRVLQLSLFLFTQSHAARIREGGGVLVVGSENEGHRGRTMSICGFNGRTFNYTFRNHWILLEMRLNWWRVEGYKRCRKVFQKYFNILQNTKEKVSHIYFITFYNKTQGEPLPNKLSFWCNFINKFTDIFYPIFQIVYEYFQSNLNEFN